MGSVMGGPATEDYEAQSYRWYSPIVGIEHNEPN